MAGLTATIDLPPRPESVRAARCLVEALMHAWAPASERCEDVVLLVSEIVSNAVEHVGGDASLALEMSSSSDHWLRVSLSDGSSVRPIVREMDSGAVRGRGMQLVAALSERWDVEDHRAGKRVWFELTL